MLGGCTLSVVAFVFGAAWGSRGAASAASPSGFSQVGGLRARRQRFFDGNIDDSGLEDDEEELELARFEQAAAVVSQDWYPRAADEAVTYVTSETEGRKPIPSDRMMTLYHQTSPD